MRRELRPGKRDLCQTAPAFHQGCKTDERTLAARNSDERLTPVIAGIIAVPRIEQVEGREDTAIFNSGLQRLPFGTERFETCDGCDPFHRNARRLVHVVGGTYRCFKYRSAHISGMAIRSPQRK